MPEFEQRQRIAADPNAVFAFVSDVSNLPRYLPTVHEAEPEPGGRIRVEGEAAGHSYDADGFFQVDQGARRIDWGAEEQDYSGWLAVGDADGGAELTVHLAFADRMPERVAQEQGGQAPPSGGPQIEEGLAASLRSIQNIVEGRGGKEEPPAARANA